MSSNGYSTPAGTYHVPGTPGSDDATHRPTVSLGLNDLNDITARLFTDDGIDFSGITDSEMDLSASFNEMDISIISNSSEVMEITFPFPNVWDDDDGDDDEMGDGMDDNEDGSLFLQQ